MRKWKEYTLQEKMMIIAIITLLIAVLFSWKRVSSGFGEGMSNFYKTSVDSPRRTGE
ncbi:hypothetical protein [Odoribacter sp. Z80]|uniref:hypothetical protein n=1 Tax=Odoribacter sp. Z80 TaxID=2304575 RepID=UPI00137A4AA0|nr:hypothetical protein [Odoribacter sp. Z80]